MIITALYVIVHSHTTVITIRTLHLCVSGRDVEDIQLFEYGYGLIPPVGRFSLGARAQRCSLYS